MMCCSDPDSAAPLDVLDSDPVVPPDVLVRRDGLVWMNTAGRLYVSRNEGQIFVLAYQGWDCDGMTRSPFLDFSRCRPLTNVRALTEEEMRLFDNTPPVMPPIPPEKIAAARKAIDTITARAKGLAGIEWPPLWVISEQGGYRWRHSTVAEQAGDVGFLSVRVPNTERGRRAAWELEGA